VRAHGVLALSLSAVLVILASPQAAAQGNWQPGDFGSARVRLGLFMPDGSSQYWTDVERAFTGSVDDFEDLTFGFDYVWRFSRTSGLMFTGSFYEGSSTRSYRDWVDDDGRPISHTAELQTGDLAVAWVLQANTYPVRPYFGLGGGILFWDLGEAGWFIDFGDPDLPIVSAAYYDDGTTLEALALAGIELRTSPGFSVILEARYRYADDTLGGDFYEAGTLDLSGLEASAGFAWNF